MPQIKPTIADQARYCLQNRVPWSWRSPHGLHTDGVILWFYTLPIACVASYFYDGPARITGFTAKGYSNTTSQVVNAVVRPVAAVMLETAEDFAPVLQQARSFFIAANIPTPEQSKTLAAKVRVIGA